LIKLLINMKIPVLLLDYFIRFLLYSLKPIHNLNF